MSKIYSLKEVKQKIFAAHGDQVKLIEETYINLATKCEFEDMERGRFITVPRSVISGVSHPSRKIEKMFETNIKKFGFKNNSQSPEWKKNVTKTWKNKTEEELKEIQEKTKETMVKNHGVEFGTQTKNNRESCTSEKSNQKRAKTWQKKDDDELLLIGKKKQETWRNKSQEEIKEIKRKEYLTKLANGSFGKSEIEDQFYEFLLTLFEKDDVERQYQVNSLSIDFYIKSKEIHIQFDGEYYHGLDRPLEEIQLLKNPTDKTILYTFNKDQKQNQWFEENNLKLIRITDKEFSKDIKNVKKGKNSLIELKLLSF